MTYAPKTAMIFRNLHPEQNVHDVVAVMSETQYLVKVRNPKTPTAFLVDENGLRLAYVDFPESVDGAYIYETYIKEKVTELGLKLQ